MDEQQCYCKRSGQIPAFGNWEQANDLPITQYFESARQAGLLRYSNSSGECHIYATRGDLYAVNFHRPPPKEREERARARPRSSNTLCPHVKEQKKQVKKKKECDVTEPPIKQLLSHKKQLPMHSTNNNSSNAAIHHSRRRRPTSATTTIRSAVDEDLYKIPPELLHTSKRKKRLGFFSRCLVPACML